MSLTVSIISYLRRTNPSTILDVTKELSMLAVDLAALDVVVFFSYLLLYAFSAKQDVSLLVSWLFWLLLSLAIAVYFAAQAAQHTEIVSVTPSGFISLLFERGLTSFAISEVARNLIITSLCALCIYGLSPLRIKRNIIVARSLYLVALIVAIIVSMVSDVVLVEEINFDEQEFLKYLGAIFIPLAVAPVVIESIARTLLLRKKDAKHTE